MWKQISAKPLISLDLEKISSLFIHTHLGSRIIAGIALAGTRVMDRMTGRAAVTSHPWKRFHGPEGARQAGMPGGGGQITGRLCDGGRRSTVRPGPLEYLVADRTCARPKAATATGRGRRPKAFRRLTPRGQAGSSDHPLQN
ncbi:hypothetical protein D8676_21955 [Mesorhizobium sp. YM1C-6-2]|nr:hypothetical protein D8676_21955 [Mesorhizobium sp. YM1C-6-2]